LALVVSAAVVVLVAAVAAVEEVAGLEWLEQLLVGVSVFVELAVCWSFDAGHSSSPGGQWVGLFQLSQLPEQIQRIA
jgi:hypothetical protein